MSETEVFFASLVGPAATFSHEMRFECHKLRQNCDFTVSAATLSQAGNEVRV